MIVSKENYKRFKEANIVGRYVVIEQITACLNERSIVHKVEIIGHSVQKRPIKSITIGKGEEKVLMWSQMHGNESTTTKALLDLMNFLDSKESSAQEIIKKCTIKIIPILNPDGAHAYTRMNANQIDLNRDAINRSQPESIVLRAVFDSFKPDFCFNLHDQRTIYNVGNLSKPATVSFLAPAHDTERSISNTRLIAMQLIAAMNETLQKIIPDQVGRYDDAFNANCVGDTFQMLNTPTILFEAGHSQEDYEREITREYIFYSMVKALDTITHDLIGKYDKTAYLIIPENNKKFFDILVRNVPLTDTSETKDVGILYTEVLEGDKISFIPMVEEEGNLDGFFGHKSYDYSNKKSISELKNPELLKLLKT